MKRVANKTGGGGGCVGGGGGVALWQPTLKAAAAAPCFLIFPDPAKQPLRVFFFFPSSTFMEDNSLGLQEKRSIASLRV